MKSAAVFVVAVVAFLMDFTIERVGGQMTPCNGFSCDGGTRCISNFSVCDNFIHCNDSSDEIRPECQPCEFHCRDDSRFCFPMSNKCDGIEHCLDGSDEDNPECPPETECPGGFRCQHNYMHYICIRISDLCDGWEDCDDGEDESPDIGCSNYIGPTMCDDYVGCLDNPDYKNDTVNPLNITRQGF